MEISRSHPASVDHSPSLRRAQLKKFASSDAMWAIWMLIPLFVGLALMYFSIVFGFVTSFTHWDIISRPRWIGFANYQSMFQDPLFYTSVSNTAYFTLVAVPIKVIFGLALAFLLNQKIKGVSFFRLAFFFPATCSVVAIAVLWGYIYDPSGLLNSLLNVLGVPKVYWLDATHALNSIIGMSVWGSVGYVALLCLAGLQNIPHEYYEAAKIDGVTKLQEIWRITIPLLSPTIFFVIVILIIGSLQTFGEVYILQGPVNSTLTIVQYIYQQAFSSFKMGYASALTYLLVAVIFVVTFIQLKLQKRWVNYDL